MTTTVTVHFAGLTGPERSGGDMASSFTLLVDGKPRITSAKYVPAYPDGSWHTATYLALAYAAEQGRQFFRSSSTDLMFVTDNKMVVQQMMLRWGANEGHYLDARSEALEALALGGVLGDTRPRFAWVAQKDNLAVRACKDLFRAYEIKSWSWKEERQKQRELSA